MQTYLGKIVCFALFLIWMAGGLCAERLRVATYNIENYTLTNRMVAGRREGDYPKPEAEKSALRFLIRAASPDVLALQEIGGPEFVEERRRDLAREGLSYAHTALLDGPDKKRQLAILSRKPFKHVIRHADIPIRYLGRDSDVARGMLTVIFDTESGDFAFHNLHLKSRLSRTTADRNADPQSEEQRLAEVDAVIQILRGPDADINSRPLALLGGDFNDSPTSNTLRRFTTGKRWRDGPLQALKAQDSRGETWTYRNLRNDYYDRSDYLLATPALAPRVVGTPMIVDLPRSDTASDHRMICADLQFDAAAPPVKPAPNSPK